MNPALQKQLDLLEVNVAARNAGLQPFPEKIDKLEEPTALPPRVELAPAEPDAVYHKGNKPLPIVEDWSDFSSRQVARVAAKLKPLALRIFTFIHLFACEVARRRRIDARSGQLSFFCPTQAIYTHLGIHRGSFYRSLKELVRLGLIDERKHRCTVGGERRCDGSLWCVNLETSKTEPARLTQEDFGAKYRDLEADIKSGNTVWARMRQSNTDNNKSIDFEYLLSWSLPDYPYKSPVTMTVARSFGPPLASFVDLPFAQRHERPQAVDQAARAIAVHLGDTANLNFYRDLLWRLLRLHSRERDHFRTVHLMILRAGTDKQENFARHAGAMLVSRLKNGGLWDELRSAGNKPISQQSDVLPYKSSTMKQPQRTIPEGTNHSFKDILQQVFGSLKAES